MSWLPQAQAFGGFLQGHIPFDVAGSIVVMMVILSALFRWINRPARAAADPAIKEVLNGLVNQKDTDQLKILWDYALHSDNIFSDRQNFLLFFESILLGGTFAIIAATTQMHSDTLTLVLTSIAFLGLLTTVCWWYIQVRQQYILRCMTEIHRRVTPAYAEVIFRIRQKPYRIGATLILVYVFPLLVALLWTALLLYV